MSSKTIYLIRHAQAEHNVREEYHIPDARLTKLGESQASAVSSRYPHLVDDATGPQIVFTSPLTRTIQTSLLAFPNHDARQTIIPIPELQENSDMPCDTGSSLQIVSSKFKQLDFSRLSQDWNSKKGRWENSQTALAARAQSIRNMLADRSEQHIALVTHGGFCSYLIGSYTRFENCECRQFQLRKRDDDNWEFVPISSEERNNLKKGVVEEIKEDSTTFASTEIPAKV